MASVGKLTADLIARTKKFEEGMDRGKRKVKGIEMQATKTKAAVAALSARMKQLAGAALALAGVGGLARLTQSAINYGSSMSDMAEQNRIGVVELQVLNAAATKAGVSIEDITRSMRNANIRTQEALDGNKKYGLALERLGLHAETFAKLETDQKLEEIAKAYHKAGKSQAAYADVAVILGTKAGPKMLEVLRRLNDEGFEKLTASAREAGLVMEESTIKRLDEAADAIEKFKLRTTIEVGEIIGGGNDYAALKKLGLNLLGIAARFGGKILDAYIEYIQMVKATFSATADFLAYRIKKAFSNVFTNLKVNFLELQLAIAAKNPFTSGAEFQKLDADLHKVKLAHKAAAADASKTWMGFFNENVLKTEASNIAENLGSFWDKLAAKQEAKIRAATEANADAASSFDSSATGVALSDSSALSASKSLVEKASSAKDYSFDKSSDPAYIAALAQGITPASSQYDSFVKAFNADGSNEQTGSLSASNSFLETNKTSDSAQIIRLLQSIANEMTA